MQTEKPSASRRFKDHIKRIIVGRYSGWIVEPAMRYMPIVREINLRGFDAPILEIGSGVSGIAPYLGRTVIGVDQQFDQPTHPLLEPRVGSVLELPFEIASQPCVVSTDMLEHVPPSLRRAAVNELVRITLGTLILAIPAGAGAEAQDRTLAILFEKERGYKFPFLTEHVDNGLPTVEEFRRLVDTSVSGSNRVASVRYISNGNLQTRELLMRLWIKSERPWAFWTWTALNRLHPLLSRMNFGKCYRTIAIVDFRESPRRQL
jgi:hypothetical protein